MAAGGGRRPACAAAALRGPAAARVRGEMSREARAFYCPPHLGLECSEEAARRWPAAAGGGARSGGAAQLGRWLAAVVGIVVVVGDARGLFIGRERGGGAVVADDRDAVGRRAPRAPLMAIGAAAARFAAAHE